MRPRAIVVIALLTIAVAGPALAGFAGTDVFLPMVGRNVGVYPSNWYTTVWIYNPGAAMVTARMYFLERSKVNLSAPWVDVTVAGGATEKLENPVEALFHLQVFGAIRVTAPSKFVVTSRVYSKAAGAGEQESVGQDFAAVPGSFAIGLNEKSQILGCYETLPRAGSEYRYNFGFVETTGHQATVTVRALDDAGVEQGSTSILVREYSQKQMAFKDYFPSLSTENTRLEIEVTAGSGKVIGYGSAVANGSQDPTTYEMTYSDSPLAGGAGLAAVSHDSTLVGDGTPASLLGLADSAVGKQKLAASGGAAGQVLSTTGSTLSWRDDGLKLPYAGVSDSGMPFHVRNTNTTASIALLGTVSSSGTYSTFPGTTGVMGYSVGGRGVGGMSEGTFPAIEGDNTGSGTGVEGYTYYGTGVGVMGQANSNHGVYGLSQTADGVRGESIGGYGVHGKSTNADGIFAEASAANKSGVYAVNSNGGGFGVFARNSSRNTTGYLGGDYGAHGVSGRYEGNLGYSDGGVFGRDATSGNYGYLGMANYAGLFNGRVSISAGGSSSVLEATSSGSGAAVTGTRGQSTGQLGTGYGVVGTHTGGGIGVQGVSASGPGVTGQSTSGDGVRGEGSAAGKSGVYGVSSASGGYGVFGRNTAGGVAVEADGDLYATGAFRGNIGPAGGAPFPRPAYDSGWQGCPSQWAECSLTLTHNLGGSPDNYVVSVEAMENGWVNSCYNNIYDINVQEHRCGWDLLDSLGLRVTKGSQLDYVRVRIWVYR